MDARKLFAKVLIVVVALAAVVLRAVRITDFVAVDRCLDNGGRRNYQNDVCEK